MAPSSLSSTSFISQKYQKLDPKEHVLKRPGMYVGSIEEDTIDLWVMEENNKMIKKQVKYTPGLYKIFDEILVNAIDHCSRLKSISTNDGEKINQVKNIKITISRETGYIEVFNDGDGIDIIKHPEHAIYIPEMIFGHMLTSANYDDTEEKTIGGQNGLGSKVCNIFSKVFEIETVDASRKLLYKQKFTDNMVNKEEPEIQKYTKKPYTIIRFLPDYEKFGTKSMTDDMFNIMKKRSYDACAVTDNDVNIYFNDSKLEYKTFEKYADLYLGDKGNHMRVFEKINERWEVIASYNQYNGFEQVSFVNGIWTIKGGKHVDYIVNQIVKKLTELIQKKKKDVTIKPSTIKDNMFIFVKSTIVNPTFDSQSKETLTSPISKFGSKADISDKFIEKLYKSGIVEKILEISEIHDNKKMTKTDGKKKTTIRGLPKLEDANFAGGPKSSQCTLILTEGDSGLSTALAGLSEVGRGLYGAFPLKGKLMNVKDQTNAKIADNEEINNLKKIIGLETGKVYNNTDDLRYGRIMIMSDQDTDGSHIRSLVFNMFHSLWPSLVSKPNFLCSLMTPIIKMYKGSSQTIQFYNLTEYENWIANNDPKGWTIKYFKGLATSDATEAKQYFKDMQCITYKYNGEASDAKFDLAFNKKLADQRKVWLSNYDRQSILDISQKEVTFDDFIDKELIHFSTYDNERSIPNICDGLKTSQRKIMFSCFKKNLTTKEIKVAQLAGYVSENSAYHHGEASLQGAIVNLAQDFVGSNNINMLMPNGQFGTRRCGGSDAGSPRYIYTLLNAISQTLFLKADADLFEYIVDDGLSVEPLWYLPIIPTILVNGACGIGTGFSTSIPCYNPLDIVMVINKLLNSENIDGIELSPWYRGFKGTIEKNASNKYVSRGVFKKTTATYIQVTELPIGMWTIDFKEYLENYMEKHPGEVKNYESHSSDNNVDFIIQFANAATCDAYMQVESNGYTKFENEFKMVSLKNFSTTNMYLFNSKCQIQKYESALDIICDFYFIRLEYYQKRKDYLLKKLQNDIDLMDNKIRFIKSVVDETLVIHRFTKDELVKTLEAANYIQHPDNGYDYLIKVPIYSITKDMVDKLEKEKKESDDVINAIRDKDIKDMWRDDIKSFLVEYEKMNEHPNKTKKTNTTNKKFAATTKI